MLRFLDGVIFVVARCGVRTVVELPKEELLVGVLRVDEDREPQLLLVVFLLEEPHELRLDVLREELLRRLDEEVDRREPHFA